MRLMAYKQAEEKMKQKKMLMYLSWELKLVKIKYQNKHMLTRGKTLMSFSSGGLATGLSLRRNWAKAALTTEALDLESVQTS